MSNIASRATITCGLAPNQWVTVLQKETPYGQANPVAVAAASVAANDITEQNPTYRGHRLACVVTYPSPSNELGLPIQQLIALAAASQVRLVVQESEDGITWTNRYATTAANDLNPGGEVTFNTYHVARWVRLVAFSLTTGMINVQVEELEEQVFPSFYPNVSHPGCSWCQVEVQTGSASTPIITNTNSFTIAGQD